MTVLSLRRAVELTMRHSISQYERLQKNQEADRWVMHKRNNPSGSSTPKPDAAPSSKPSSSRPSASASASDTNSHIRSRLLDKSLASSRPSPSVNRNSKFKSVISTTTSGEGDDDELGRRVKKEGGGEQGDDEFDYDEEFQDDEEGIARIDDLADEQETKELEVRCGFLSTSRTRHSTLLFAQLYLPPRVFRNSAR